MISAQVQILGTLIREDSKGFLCINDLFRASGSNASKKPKEWLKRKRTRELLELDEGAQNPLVVKQALIDGIPQKLTYVEPVMFLNYAGYLSAKVERLAYKSLFDLMEKQAKVIKLQKQDIANRSVKQLAEVKRNTRAFYVIVVEDGYLTDRRVIQKRWKYTVTEKGKKAGITLNKNGTPQIPSNLYNK